MRRISETSGGFDNGATGVMSGLAAGTRIGTETGWRDVTKLSEGDLVLTFDAGMQRISKVTRRLLWNGIGDCPGRYWPLHVPAGALGNRAPMTLLPNQAIMIESDGAEERYGDPFSLIPATALEGVNGIQRGKPDAGQEVFTLHFDSDQVVFDSSGALFLCPSARDLIEHALAPVGETGYAMRPLHEARVLAREIEYSTAAICDQSQCEGIVAA